MKKLLLIMMVLAFVACQQGNKKEKDAEAVKVEVVKAEFDIGGMHCNNCVASVEKGVNTLEGIASVAVSLNDSNAIVEFDASKVDTEKIKAAIEKRGFTVKN